MDFLPNLKWRVILKFDRPHDRVVKAGESGLEIPVVIVAQRIAMTEQVMVQTADTCGAGRTG